MNKINMAYYIDESKPWFRPEALWPEYVPKNIEFTKINLYEMLVRSAEKFANKPAMWFVNTFMSYREFIDHVDRMSTSLERLGLKKGDVAALAMPSSFQYAIAYYACAKLGVIVTGLNPLSKPIEIVLQLQTVGAKTLIVLDFLYEFLFASIKDEYDFDRIIVTGMVDLVKMTPEEKEMGKKLGKIPAGQVPDSAIDFNELLNSESSPVKQEVKADDILTYAMTGGTTGVPKAALLTHFNCISSAIIMSKWHWSEPGGCVVGVLPLFHIFGIIALHTTIYNGGYMLLFPQPPQTEDLVKTICNYGEDGNTSYPGAEVLFQQLADFTDLSEYPIQKKLSRCLSSAGPLHKHVRDRFEENVPGVLLREGYGLTESCSGISIGAYVEGYPPGNIGLPLPGIDWKIVDMETGKNEVSVGETGELIIAGPVIMKGYLNNPEETAEALREMDGKTWLHTGDIGRMDEYGRVSLSDRKKQLIKVKGFSVFPTEVENLVGRHEGVYECAVAGLPDPKTGEAVKAWVVLKDEWKGKLTEDELKDWCKENITYYKVPKYIEIIDGIPKTPVGKVLRRQLQEADPLYKTHQNKLSY